MSQKLENNKMQYNVITITVLSEQFKVIYTYIYTYTHIYTHIHIHTYIYMHIYIHIYTIIHIYIHKYIGSYITTCEGKQVYLSELESIYNPYTYD